MVRAPCCEKMGLKKGPWSPEEDRILTAYIEKHGHPNWRALPKQAGLLRCGKSCRLRWMNYLRPDIKRGNFTGEEEDNIIKLHQMIGNRWSAIAARLPGRTDNEIKNVWHTHLKKRLQQNQQTTKSVSKKKASKCDSKTKKIDSSNSQCGSVLSPQPSSSSEFSTVTDASNLMTMDEVMQCSMESFPPIDESFWSDTSSMHADIPTQKVESPSLQVSADHPNFTGDANQQFPQDFSNATDGRMLQNSFYSDNNQETGGISSFINIDDDMDFWYDLFINSGELQGLPEF